MNERGNPNLWFQWQSLLDFWASNYGAHEGCHLWPPYQKDLKLKSLNSWDTQQVDKCKFSRIGQHSTTTGTRYIHMNQSATEYRTAVFLHLCVRWTSNSTGMLYYLYFKLFIYNHIMIFCVVTCVNVEGHKCLKGTCQLHLQDQTEGKRCDQVI